MRGWRGLVVHLEHQRKPVIVSAHQAAAAALAAAATAAAAAAAIGAATHTGALLSEHGAQHGHKASRLGRVISHETVAQLEPIISTPPEPT